jgi:hypothetical protein
MKCGFPAKGQDLMTQYIVFSFMQRLYSGGENKRKIGKTCKITEKIRQKAAQALGFRELSVPGNCLSSRTTRSAAGATSAPTAYNNIFIQFTCGSSKLVRELHH